MKEHLIYNQLAGRKVQCIEAISDGVFAIALTLLILDIKVPVSESIRSESDLFHALSSLTPKFMSYFLSFMTLDIFWTGQSVQYTYIEKSDRHLNWLALFFLLFVSILPFTTAFLSEHIHFSLSILLYWLNILFLGITIYIHWIHAYNHGFVALPEPESKQVYKVVKQRIITAQSLYAGGALLCFVSNYLSIAVIIIIQLNYAIAFGFRKRRVRAKP
jgi:uncharacterized membrane protein